MISPSDLTSIAYGHLSDAEVLYEAGRFDGAIYQAGYGVELALKARACKTLAWNGFPETNSEFKQLQSFKTHDLDVLLRLSGWEQRVKTRYLEQWSAVAQWSPEARYKLPGSATEGEARQMLDAARHLVERL